MKRKTTPNVCDCCCQKFTDRKNITRCKKCSIVLCSECAEMGAELGSHKKDHLTPAVTITDDVLAEWNRSEERKLILAAHRHKAGNWQQIQKAIGTKRSVEDLMDRFNTLFVNGPIGRFARNDVKWHEEKSKIRSSSRTQSLVDKNSCDDFIFSFYLAALRWKSDVTLLPGSENLEEEVQKIAEEYAAFKGNLDSCDLLIIDRSGEKPEEPKVVKCNREVKAVDPLDPSSDEEGDQDMQDSRGSEVKSEQFPVDGRCRQNSTFDENDELEEDGHRQDSAVGEPHSTDKFIAKTKNSDMLARMGGERCHPDILEFLPKINLSAEDETSALAMELNAELDMNDTEMSSFSPPPNKRKRGFDSSISEGKKETEEPACQKIAKIRRQHQQLAMFSTRPVGETPVFCEKDLLELEFNPKRNDFLMESVNDSEKLVSEITMGELPNKNMGLINFENNVKFCRIQQYKRFLTIRNARKNAVLEHDMFKGFAEFQDSVQASKGKKTASQLLEERPVEMKLYSRMQQTLEKAELDQFKEKMKKFNALQDRIQKLQEMQRQGITSLNAKPPSQKVEEGTMSSQKKAVERAMSSQKEAKEGTTSSQKKEEWGTPSSQKNEVGTSSEKKEEQETSELKKRTLRNRSTMNEHFKFPSKDYVT